MKKPIMLLLTAVLTTALITTGCSDPLEEEMDSRLVGFGDGKKYAWKLVQTETGMPKKVCKDHGYDCKKKDQKMMTQDEWDTYFPEIETMEELVRININDYPDYVDYLISTGFGQ